jgi:poly-gamma-glutamate synthesis protein (capsule biosynthesis protein)
MVSALWVLGGLAALGALLSDAARADEGPPALSFRRACEAGEEVIIAAVGDVLIHHELQIQAWREPDRFGGLWRGVADLIAGADLAYANLEGPTARAISRKGRRVRDPGEVFDNDVYTGYPRFNYHPALVEDLKAAGFDVVSTANNHALDRGGIGADLTIDALNAAGLAFTGTVRGDSKRRRWHALTEAKGVRVAWVACGESTNGIADPLGQVLMCDDAALLALVRELAASKAHVDAVIVTPHWGSEYAHKPNKFQQSLARGLIDAGAVAVIGNHPHVIQPWERYTTKRGVEGLIMYSIGNFVSHQPQLSKRSTLLLYVGLKRSAVTGEVFVSGAGYVPLHTRHDPTPDHYYTEAIDRVRGFDDARSLIVSLMGSAALLPPTTPTTLSVGCEAAAPHQDP